jgi:serine/threonine protein phosphatase PrpC
MASMATTATTATATATAKFNLTRAICESNSTIDTYDGKTYSKSIVQNTSRQDACGYVHTEEMSVLWCSDSHGGHIDKKRYKIRDFLSTISDEKWIEYVSQENFHIADIDETTGGFKSNLFRDIASLGPYRDTGATLSIVKISHSQIECYRVGDSPIYVFQNDENSLYSNHDSEYNEDLKQLKKREYLKDVHSNNTSENGVTDQSDIMPLSPTTMGQKPSHYIYWDSATATNMTRCIGHNDPIAFWKRKERANKENKQVEVTIPCWTMTKNVIERQPDVKEKVILATDGLTAVCGEFDYPMMVASQSAVDIMDVAYNRWRQDWEFNVRGFQQANSRIPDWNRDDIAIVSWQNTETI